MFSQLGPLFKTVLRQTESADTRLAIRRDDRQEQGKKQDSEEAEADSSPLWEDSTTVSVEALRTFLIEFLKSRGDDVPEAGPENPESRLLPELAPEQKIPSSTVAARAVKAYTAISGQHHYTPPPETPPDNPPQDLAGLLKADEVRTMHVLIQELDLMARQGVQTLTIEKADTFLEALVAAVRAYKAPL